MKRFFSRTQLTLLGSGALIFCLPLLALVALGFYTLYLKKLLIDWLILLLISSVVAALCWRAGSALRRRELAKKAEELPQGINAEPFWGEHDRLIWQEVCRLANEVSEQQMPKDAKDITEIAERLLLLVASHYYPAASDPRLEVSASALMVTLEAISQDLREIFVESLPFHDSLTIGDLIRAKRTYDLGNAAYRVYRLLRPLTNPASALVAEIRSLLASQASKRLTEQTSSLLLASIIQTSGKHLINLYSGKSHSKSALHDAEAAIKQPGSGIRLLLLGQAKSGKSTLQTALCRSIVDDGHPYSISTSAIAVETSSGEQLVIEEFPSYESKAELSARSKELFRAYSEADAVVFVLSAVDPARAADAACLSLLNERSREKSEAKRPIIFALTKIDLLRPPAHWNPPYNIENPAQHREPASRQKAENISASLHAAAKQLSCAAERGVPLAIRDEEQYNVEALALVLSHLLPQARAFSLQRILARQKDELYWSRLGNSLSKSGAILAKRGIEQAVKQIGHWGERIRPK